MKLMFWMGFSFLFGLKEIIFLPTFIFGFCAATATLASAPMGTVHINQLNQKPTHVVTIYHVASWYGNKFQNRRMANGERFDQWKLTAAHRTLPLGTKVRVTNLKNGKSVVVKITDRGPYPTKLRVKKPRQVAAIDLSRMAGMQIGMIKDGVVPVRIEVLT